MARDDSGSGSFLAELRRRRVVRVAVVYGAAAFAMIQAADVIFPRVPLPDWTVGLVVWLAILGFPVALALAWAFDLTPGGLQRTTSAGRVDLQAADAGAAPVVASPVATPSWVGRRTVLFAGALLLLGLGTSAGWFLRPCVRRGEPAGRYCRWRPVACRARAYSP